MVNEEFPPKGSDLIVDHADLRSLENYKREKREKPYRPKDGKQPKKRKIGRHILIFLLAFAFGWFVRGFGMPDGNVVSIPSFSYPVQSIQVAKIFEEDGQKTVLPANLKIDDHRPIRIRFNNETIRYDGLTTDDTFWAGILKRFSSSPVLYINDSPLHPGSELTPYFLPEHSLTYSLELRDPGTAEVQAEFDVVLEMDAGAWLMRAREVADPEIKKVCLEKAIESNPDDVGTLMEFAGLLTTQEDEEGAVEIYRSVLQKEPGNVAAKTFLAEYYRKKDPQNALKLYDELADEDNANRLDHLKKVAQLQKRLGLSNLKTYQKILDMNSDDTEAAEAVGDIYSNQISTAKKLAEKKSLTKAIAVIKRAMQIHQDDEIKEYLAKLYYDRGNYRADRKSFKQAIADYRSSLKWDDNPYTYLYLADSLQKVKEYDEAVEAVKKAENFNAQDNQLKINLRILWGNILLAQNKSSDAVEKFEEVLKLKPNDPLVLETLGATYWKAGKLEKALDAYRDLSKLIASNPAKDRAEIQRHIGDIYRSLGEKEEKDPKKKLKQYEEALKAYEEALALAKGDKELQKRWEDTAEKRHELKIRLLQSS